MSDIMPKGYKIRFNLEVLQRLDWLTVFQRCTSTKEYVVEEHLKSVQDGSRSEGDDDALGFWTALSALLSLVLRGSDPAVPLHTQLTTPESRTAALDDFPSETLQNFGNLLTDKLPPVIGARVADAIWIRLRKHEAGRRAVKDYLRLAETDLDNDRSVYAVPRIVRAARIAAELDRNGDLFRDTMGRVEKWVGNESTQSDDSYLVYELLKLILDQYWGDDPLVWADRAASAAKIESRRSRLERARDFWELEIRFCRRGDDHSQRIKATQERVAQSYLDQAQTGTHGQKAHWITKSIEAWRRVGGNRDRIDELITQLKEEHKLGVEEMAEIRTPFDGTELLESGRKCVADRPGIDALISLAQAIRTPVRSEIEDEIKAELKHAPLAMMSGREYQTAEGNVAARIPPLDLGTEENSEWLLGNTLVKYAQHQSFVAMTFIEGARHELAHSENDTLAMWCELVRHNPFVPSGREEIFIRGLHAGLVGDFLQCAHLLIPQLENSIRYVVGMAGGVVTYVPSNDSSIQREVDLNQLLGEAKFSAKTKEVFGEDLVLNMRALLVGGVPPNLRNRVSHGLEDHDGFFSSHVVYLWWLAIRLCAQGYLYVQRHTEHPDAPPPADAGRDLREA